LNVLGYAQFIADFLEHMAQNGVPIGVLSIAKEWKAVLNNKKRAEVITALKTECKNRKISMPKIIGPATWSVKGAISELRAIKKSGNANLYAGFSTHKYNEGTEQDVAEFVKLSKLMNKVAIDDETNTGSPGRTNGVDDNIGHILKTYAEKAMNYRAGLMGEIFFEPWSRGVSSETRSIYFTHNKPGVRLRPYWVMKEFVTHTSGSIYLPSSVSLEASPDNFQTMCFQKENQLALWVINPSEEDIDKLNLTLKSKSLEFAKSATLYQWQEDNVKANVTLLKPTQTSKTLVDIAAKSLNLILVKL